MSTKTYNLAVVREMLTAAFNNDALRDLAFDHFPEVNDNLPNSVNKGELIRQIIDHANKRFMVDRIVAYTKRKNPAQYQVYAERLIEEEEAGVFVQPAAPMVHGYQQRLADLQGHIRREQDLLAEYEEQRDDEEDPRRRRRIERNIERQKKQLADYQKQLAALNGDVQQTQGTTPAVAQPSYEELTTEIQSMQAKLDELLAGNQDVLDELDSLTRRILRRIDKRHWDTVKKLAAKMDEQHVETTELLLDAADKQQIAQWDAQELNLQVQQVLLSMRRAAKNQPDQAYWEELLTAVNEYSNWDQKLKFTLPLIPGILEFESEAAVDALPKLRELWNGLAARFRKDG